MMTIYFKEGENKEMLKKVNIYPQAGPITSVNPTIRTALRGAVKSISDIKKCLMARAKVEEILSDGSLKQLTLYNYADTFEPKVEDDKPTEQDKEEVIVEDPKPTEEVKPEPEPEVTVVDISLDPEEDTKEEATDPEEEEDEPDVDTFDLEEL